MHVFVSALKMVLSFGVAKFSCLYSTIAIRYKTVTPFCWYEAVHRIYTNKKEQRVLDNFIFGVRLTLTPLFDNQVLKLTER